MSFLLYKRADDAVFDNFPKISDHFPKISQRQPKKIRRCFHHTPTNFTVVEGTKEKCYQIWNLHMWGYHIVFNQFVTTQYTIDFYITNTYIQQVLLLKEVERMSALSAGIPACSLNMTEKKTNHKLQDPRVHNWLHCNAPVSHGIFSPHKRQQ